MVAARLGYQVAKKVLKRGVKAFAAGARAGSRKNTTRAASKLFENAIKRNSITTKAAMRSGDMVAAASARNASKSIGSAAFKAKGAAKSAAKGAANISKRGGTAAKVGVAIGGNPTKVGVAVGGSVGVRREVNKRKKAKAKTIGGRAKGAYKMTAKHRAAISRALKGKRRG